ncbi:hypothetical protein [Actinomadura oligospora]|uniref:hypothetical protein n=1 Tax=Actinomadura oligospora TaxID=111804 RepID=UPI00054F3730|nr:hypothetical protein [Actinomadura oligospora]
MKSAMCVAVKAANSAKTATGTSLMARAADRWVETSRRRLDGPRAHNEFGTAFSYAGDFERARRHLKLAGVVFPGEAAKAMRRDLGLKPRHIRRPAR